MIKKNFQAMVPSLIFIFCIIHIWSKNTHVFSIEQFFVSFLAMIGISIFLFYFFIFTQYTFNKFIPRYAKIINAALIAVLSGIIANFFLLKISYSPSNHAHMHTLIILVFFLIYNDLIKFFNVFITMMIFISGCSFIKDFTYNYYAEKKYVQQFTSQNELNNLNIIFNTKPNVYLFWQESYQPSDILQHFYNYDNSYFDNYLKNNNFTIYPNTYSSGRHTLMALYQTYTLGKYEDTQLMRGHNDILSLGRRIISGNNLNLVFKTFKNNGYENTFAVTRDVVTYYVTYQNENLDNVYPEETKTFYRNLIPLFVGTKYYKDFVIFVEQPANIIDMNKYKTIDLYEVVQQVYKKATIPQFVIIKGGACHIDDKYNYKDKENYIKTKRYQNWIEKANHENIKIIDFIIKNDPNSIIILLGDHGPNLTCGLELKQNKLYDIKSGKHSEAFTVQEFIDDRYKVIMAVRMPNGENYDLSQGYYMNNINIFMHVFSYLANDKQLLSKRVRSTVKEINGEIVLDEGTIIMNQ